MGLMVRYPSGARSMRAKWPLGAYIAIGAGAGVGIGALLGNIGVGVAIGVAVGVALGAARGRHGT